MKELNCIPLASTLIFFRSPIEWEIVNSWSIRHLFLFKSHGMDLTRNFASWISSYHSSRHDLILYIVQLTIIDFITMMSINQFPYRFVSYSNHYFNVYLQMTSPWISYCATIVYYEKVYQFQRIFLFYVPDSTEFNRIGLVKLKFLRSWTFSIHKI